MSYQLYLQCFMAAFLGWIISVCVKQASLMKKARVANVQFKASEYFTEDYWAIIATFAFIGVCLLSIEHVLNLKPTIMAYVSPGFAFVGYTGSDLALRLFSKANDKLNSAIDYKTTIADKQSGTLDAPTPK